MSPFFIGLKMSTLSFPTIHIVLHEPEIPPNTGNIGRTVLGVNGRLHLVGHLGFRLNEQSLRRAGLDYWPHLDLRRWNSLEELELTKKRCFLFTKTGRHYFDEVNYQPGDYLIFGSESKGLPQTFLDTFPTQTVQFPTLGAIRSYNLASCVHAACMEFVRQNKALLQPHFRKMEREQPH